MVMNKSEKKAMEDALTCAALRWPTEAEPEPMTIAEIERCLIVLPLKGGETSSRMMQREGALGWSMNSYTGYVEPAWANRLYHGRGHYASATASQGIGRMYSTKREAILAMRWEVCREVAKRLRDIDKRLESEGK